jgi:peptide-methionine (S)-S-oxide reductase
MRTLRRSTLILAAFSFAIALSGLGARASSATVHARTEHVVLAGGCFWGMEGVFSKLKGVTSVVSGYSGGNKLTAQYEMVSTGTTGHAESVDVTYDPANISFENLLAVYFTVAHDPTTLDRQGPDSGSQYRSEIFYTTAAQKRASLAYIDRLTKTKAFSSPIVTKVAPLAGFYPAEEYHQHFMERNPDYPYIVYNDAPKVKALRERFPELVKAQ